MSVIELNGKRYDAITGTYLGKSHVIPKHITDSFVHGKVIDGFVRPQPVKKTPAPEKAAPPQAVEAKPAEHKTAAHKPHAPANHVKAHHPEHSKTLMRHRAGKPQFSLKNAIKTQAPAEVMAKPQSALMHKRSAYGIDPVRKERAAASPKHHAVKHFTTPAIHSVSTQVPAITVRPAPLQLTTRPTPAPAKHHNNVFEDAIARATSHEQPAHKARRRHSSKRRVLNSLAFVAAFLVIGGFVSYINMPGIELRVASVQAGFGASMPTYAPTGYALNGGVQRSGGTISLSFRSGDQAYRVTQQSSDWNSQTLLDNTLALNGKHETVQENGQTIYIYEDIYKNGGTSAAWVNGGVRYDITGNAQLSKQDITHIATSL